MGKKLMNWENIEGQKHSIFMMGQVLGVKKVISSGKVVALPEFIIRRCPYCQQRLGIMEILKRKMFRHFRCKKCCKMIDERMIYR